MNERIRRFMEQAVVSIDGQTFGKTYIPDAFTEKFAELIVRECITALKTNTEGYDSRAMFLMTEMINRSESILLQHFGVEV